MPAAAASSILKLGATASSYTHMPNYVCSTGTDAIIEAKRHVASLIRYYGGGIVDDARSLSSPVVQLTTHDKKKIPPWRRRRCRRRRRDFQKGVSRVELHAQRNRVYSWRNLPAFSHAEGLFVCCIAVVGLALSRHCTSLLLLLCINCWLICYFSGDAAKLMAGAARGVRVELIRGLRSLSTGTLSLSTGTWVRQPRLGSSPRRSSTDNRFMGNSRNTSPP